MPVFVEESPGVITALDWTLPLILPFPNRDPPCRVSRPEEERTPSSVVMPPDWLKLLAPPILNLLPLAMVSIPAFVKLPAVVKFRLPLMVKLPPLALLAKLARALALD